MQLGIALPNGGAHASAELLRQIASRAEQLNFASLWSYDRLLFANQPRNGYGRQIPWPDNFKYTMDPLDVLSFLAANTTKVRLGTSVINLPFYNPVQLARRLTTIDQLSNGRLMVGGGLGWSEDEYEASGVPFAKRGKRADELLTLLIKIWTENPVSFAGEFYSLPDSTFDLKPVQKPHPPLYLGMFSPAGLRRTGRFANGWNPAGLPLDKLQQMFNQVKEHAAAAGRDPDQMKVLLRVFVDVDKSLGNDAPRYVGPADKVAAELAEAAEAGVDTLIASLKGPAGSDQSGIDDYLENMARIKAAAPAS